MRSHMDKNMSAAPLRANGSAFLLVAYPMLVALRQVAEARGPPQRGEFERGPMKFPNHPPSMAIAPQKIPSVARWMEQPAEGASAKLRPSAWQQQHSLRVARSLETGGTWRRTSLICSSLQSASAIWLMPSGKRLISAGTTIRATGHEIPAVVSRPAIAYVGA